MAKYNIENGYLPEDILQSAFHHYEAAKLLLERSPDYFDSGGYMLHLSIELMFKAWILNEQKEFDSTHSLQNLRQVLIESGEKLPFTKQENKVLTHLDGLYELRYPNRNQPTEIGSEEIQLVEPIVEKIWQSLSESLVIAFNKIPPGSKGGRIYMRKPKEIPIDPKLILGE